MKHSVYGGQSTISRLSRFLHPRDRRACLPIPSPNSGPSGERFRLISSVTGKWPPKQPQRPKRREEVMIPKHHYMLSSFQDWLPDSRLLFSPKTKNPQDFSRGFCAGRLLYRPNQNQFPQIYLSHYQCPWRARTSDNIYD